MTPGTSAATRFFAVGHSQVVDEHDRLLWQTLEGLTQGGKRFRPALLTDLYGALGGQHPAVAATVAEAVELLHTAFVIHDDVIDGDQVRRGRPNVGGTFATSARALGAGTERARGYGEAAGILAGDLALVGAVRMVALCGAPPPLVARLLDLMEDVVHRSAAGELADVRVSVTGRATVQETLDIAEWKTAAYSFQLPLQAAAILADAPEEVIAGLGTVGRCLGTAFQLRDDLQGVFGTLEQTGKDPLSDLREGKCTALIAIASSTSQWEELARHVGDPAITADDAARARELLVACGARRAVETLVHDLRESALTAAETLPAAARDALRVLVESLLPGASSRPTLSSAAVEPGVSAQVEPGVPTPVTGSVAPPTARDRVRGAA